MLGIAVEKVTDLIARAKQFDVKVDVVGPPSGANLSDDDIAEVLEDYPDDPVEEELTEFLSSLNEDEQIALVALTWVGRGTFGSDDWDEAVKEAKMAHNDHTAEYLLGIPLLGTYLEEALSQLDYDIE